MIRMSNWKMFALSLPLFLLLDLVWLGVIMRDFYSHELGLLARRIDGQFSPRWGAAILVYLMIPAGLVLFVRPKLANATYWQAAFWGAMYGFVLYGVYDLTNLAILNDWTLTMTVVDIVWGMTLSAALGLFMRYLDRPAPGST